MAARTAVARRLPVSGGSTSGGAIDLRRHRCHGWQRHRRNRLHGQPAGLDGERHRLGAGHDGCDRRRGGLPDLTGQVVVIRPNVIEGQAGRYHQPRGDSRRHPRGEAKGRQSRSWWQRTAFNGAVLPFMQTLGITAVCTAEGATPTELKNTAFTNRRPANAAAWANGLDFYDTVYNADYVINVPSCKTHGIRQLQLGVEGLVRQHRAAE